MNKPSEIFNANYVCILMLYIHYNNCHLWWLILFLDLLEKQCIMYIGTNATSYLIIRI